MDLQLENSPRTAGTRRLLIGLAAVTGLVCGAGGALAQGQRARSAPSAPPPPVASDALLAPATPPAPPAPPAPSPLAPRVFALGSGPASYIFKGNENGRKIELRLENNEIVAAKVDGQDVPKDRIVREGDTIVFNNEKGETLFKHTVSQPERRWLTASADPFQRITIAGSGKALGSTHAWSGTIPGPDDPVFVEMEPPKVMLGVTMMEPDSSLRGHLGLEPGTSTLVGAVYGGLPASAAGLKPYDIIVAVNGEKPANTETIRAALRKLEPGDEITFTVIHRGKEREAKIKLEKYDRERFDETKVESIAQVMEESDARIATFLSQPGATAQGSFIGVPSDPNNPATAFFDPSTAVDMQRLLREAQERAEAERERALEMLERYNDKSSQAKSMEDRMRRLEEMLQKLLDDKTGGKEEGGGAGAEPVPDELRPSKGLWAGRNPAA